MSNRYRVYWDGAWCGSGLGDVGGQASAAPRPEIDQHRHDQASPPSTWRTAAETSAATVRRSGGRGREAQTTQRQWTETAPDQCDQRTDPLYKQRVTTSRRHDRGKLASSIAYKHLLVSTSQLRLRPWAFSTHQLATSSLILEGGSPSILVRLERPAIYFKGFLFWCSPLMLFCCMTVCRPLTARTNDRTHLCIA